MCDIVNLRYSFSLCMNMHGFSWYLLLKLSCSDMFTGCAHCDLTSQILCIGYVISLTPFRYLLHSPLLASPWVVYQHSCASPPEPKTFSAVKAASFIATVLFLDSLYISFTALIFVHLRGRFSLWCLLSVVIILCIGTDDLVLGNGQLTHIIIPIIPCIMTQLVKQTWDYVRSRALVRLPSLDALFYLHTLL